MMVMPMAMPVPMSMTMPTAAAIFIMAFSAISEQIAMLIRIALYVKIDRIGEIFDRTKLIDRDVSCRSIDHCWNAVNDISTRVLDRCWLCDREFRIGLAKDLPIAQIAIIRTIHLTDALRLYNGPLVSLSGDHRAHADALSSWDGLTHRLGIRIDLSDERNTFLCLRFDRPAHEVTERFVRVPHIGRLDLFRVRERFLEFLRRQIDTMRLCKCKPIIPQRYSW